MAAVQEVQQMILTTTDWNDFTPAFLAQAHRLEVAAGVVSHDSVTESASQRISDSGTH